MITRSPSSEQSHQLHDLSKYSPTEFLVGCKYYQGTRSPNNAEREATGVSMSWLHHKGRNRHHFEHWVDYSLDGEHVIMGARMPRQYVLPEIPSGNIWTGHEATPAYITRYENNISSPEAYAS